MKLTFGRFLGLAALFVPGLSQFGCRAGFGTAEYTQYIPDPMSPDTADHVAAVVLMGKPSDHFVLGMADDGAAFAIDRL